MTPNDVKDILNGLGKWSIGMGIVCFTVYLAYIGRIDADIIATGATAVIAFYFGGKKN